MGGGDNIKYYAQELKENTYNLTRMNLVMRGILPNNIVTRNGDTLEEDWPYFDDNDPVNTYDPLYVDAVVSNPPYSQSWNPADKESDPRYRFGLAPKGKADYAFLLHDLYHLKPDGIMTIVLPHGVLFRGGTEGAIRRNLVEYNHIDAIIGLPANIFFGTGIPTIIMVLKQKRENTDVLIVDASKGFAKVGKNNVLRACDIKKIVDVVSARADVEKFAKVVSLDEIRGNDYNLNIPRYVDSSDKNERWDIFATMFGGIPLSELADFHEYWAAFPHLKDALFTASGEAHCRLNVANLKSSVLDAADVTAFTARYASSFADFEAFLTTRLLDGMETLNITREKSIISDDVFSRLNGLPLIDKYKAYQLLDDEWKKIAVDLEIIRTEGFASSKQVDPNMVVKTKDGKKQEVQDGWIGHIIPFALVQQTLLAADLARLNAREARLSELAAEYESLLNELSEEDKDKPFVNDEGDAFVPKEVAKAIKSMEVEPETLAVLRKVNALNNEEKSLKKQIKADSTALHLLTKKTIEELTDEQARQMIKLKWIPPVLDSMAGLPSAVIADFIARLLALAGKYETTFTEVDSQIAETESSLVSLLDELTGNEFDMQGIQELKSLLGGSAHE